MYLYLRRQVGEEGEGKEVAGVEGSIVGRWVGKQLLQIKRQLDQSRGTPLVSVVGTARNHTTVHKLSLYAHQSNWYH